jgi:hypothetical protein
MTFEEAASFLEGVHIEGITLMQRMRFMPADEEERTLWELLTPSWFRFILPLIFLGLYLALPLFIR